MPDHRVSELDRQHCHDPDVHPRPGRSRRGHRAGQGPRGANSGSRHGRSHCDHADLSHPVPGIHYSLASWAASVQTRSREGLPDLHVDLHRAVYHNVLRWFCRRSRQRWHGRQGSHLYTSEHLLLTGDQKLLPEDGRPRQQASSLQHSLSYPFIIIISMILVKHLIISHMFKFL